MKHYLLILALLQATASFSQTDQEMEAIVNYQNAEEAFDIKEFGKALGYLEQSKKIMGNKPKILYLQIVITLENYNNNSKSINDLLSLIEIFEKSQDIDSFAQEKRLFITKNKLLLKEKLAQIIAQEEKEKQEFIKKEKKEKLGKENFEKFTLDNVPFDLTVEEFQKQYPNILPKNFKITKLENCDIYYSKKISFEDKECWLPYNSASGNPVYDINIHAVFVKEGKVIGFQKNLFYYNSKGQGNLNAYDASLKKNNYYKAYLELFAFEPQNGKWIWLNNDYKYVILQPDDYQDPKNNKRWKHSLAIRVINYPTIKIN